MKTTFKKTMAVILSLLLILSAMSVIGFAADASASDDSLFFTAGDYSIHYRIVKSQGESKGKILFVHGFLYSGETWRDMADVMSENGYDCYIADLPNYGESTRENGEIAQVDREDLLVELMESYGPLNEWTLCGHSMGGGVALNIACEHPELKSLMLYCPSEVNMPGSSILNPLTESSLFQKCFSGLFNMLVKNKTLVKLALFAVTKSWDCANSYDSDTLINPLISDGTATGIFYSMAYSRNTDMNAVSKISVPTMLVWADSDIVLSSGNVSNISKALPGAEVHNVKGSHIVIETDPEKMAELAIDFLN